MSAEQRVFDPALIAFRQRLEETLVHEPPRVHLLTRLRALSLPRLTALSTAGLVLVLELLARRDLYGLRVTGDSPSYIGLLYRLAQHPLQRVNAYFPGVETSHATPDLQLSALLWRAGHGTGSADPVAAYRLLALTGLMSSALLLHATFVWVRRHAGSRAAWISIPVLLTLFGPAHVIWAGDLSLHGLLYAGFYSQTLGLALALYALTTAERPGAKALPLTIVLVAATMTVHPFTGLLLAALLSIQGGWLALNRHPGWWKAPPAIACGFGLGSLWPSYRLNDALAAGGASGTTLVLLLAALPIALSALDRDLRRIPLAALDRLPLRFSNRAYSATAVLGLLGVLAIAGWEAAMIWGPSGASWSRLNVYWIDHLGRWPLLFSAGSVGLIGLYVLAKRGKPLPMIWFTAFYLVGVAGALGAPLPLWYRFLLFCQPPLVLGVAIVVADRRRRVAHVLVAAAAGLSLAFSVYTFVAVSSQTSYYGGGWIPDAFLLGKMIPAGDGGVISDPATSYYIPAATGRRVLTVSAAHVGSPAEMNKAKRGYAELQTLYKSRGTEWWTTLRRLWREGFRYVVVAHTVSLSQPTLKSFSDAPQALESGADRRRLGRYFWALNRVATLVADTKGYAVYRLDKGRVL